jgi:hypothetical protein
MTCGEFRGGSIRGLPADCLRFAVTSNLFLPVCRKKFPFVFMALNGKIGISPRICAKNRHKGLLMPENQLILQITVLLHRAAAMAGFFEKSEDFGTGGLPLFCPAFGHP